MVPVADPGLPGSRLRFITREKAYLAAEVGVVLPVQEHSVPAYSTDRLIPALGESRAAAFGDRLRQVAAVLKGRRLVNVTGDDRRKGGVYEIMRTTLPYLRGAGVDV